MYVLSVVFGSVIKIEYHKSGQECLEQKLKEIKKKLQWRGQSLSGIDSDMQEYIHPKLFVLQYESLCYVNRLNYQLDYEFEKWYDHCTC